MLDLGLLAGTFGVVFLAELPDKSLFASLVLGTRYRAGLVWLGVSLAFVVHVVIAVAAGGVLALLPHTLVEVVVALLFLLGAALLLRPHADDVEEDAADEAAEVRARIGRTPSARRVVTTCFAVVFVGEWGDITQIAIANLTAKYHAPVSVGLGAASALIAVSGLAIRLGSALLARVRVELVRTVAGLVLLALALLTLVQLVR